MESWRCIQEDIVEIRPADAPQQVTPTAVAHRVASRRVGSLGLALRRVTWRCELPSTSRRWPARPVDVGDRIFPFCCFAVSGSSFTPRWRPLRRAPPRPVASVALDRDPLPQSNHKLSFP